MNKQCKFDIIIPIYNCESYIQRCIRSIILQNKDNLHLILVDDGSTDNSGRICDSFGRKYSCVEVIHVRNNGVSNARNVGLKAAKGDYFTFIDADDWISSNYFNIASKEIKLNSPDILMFPFKRVYPHSVIKGNYYFGRYNHIFNSCDTFYYVYRRLFGLIGNELSSPLSLENISPVWGKFYKTELFKNIHFVNRNEICSEDTWFNICCFRNANKTDYCFEAIYYYNKRNLSSAVNTYNKDMFDEYKKLYKLMELAITKEGLPQEFTEAFNNRIVLNQVTMLRNITNSELSILTKLQLTREILQDPIYERAYLIFPLSKLPFTYRVLFKCFYKKRIISTYLFLIIGEKIKGKINI